MVAQDTTSGLEHYGADCDHSGTLHVGTGVPQRQYLVVDRLVRVSCDPNRWCGIWDMDHQAGCEDRTNN